MKLSNLQWDPLQCVRHFLTLVNTFLVTAFLMFGGCKERTVQSSQPVLQASLKLTQTGLHHLTFSLEIPEIHEGDRYQLLRDNQRVFHGLLSTHALGLMDTMVVPSTGYLYQALITRADGSIDYSNKLYVRTTDSTTHDWSFTIEQIGNEFTSIHSIYVIDPDTSIWIAGDILVTPDKVPGWDGDYTVGHWDGRKWTFWNPTGYGIGGEKFILAIGGQRMLTSRALMTFDGTKWTRVLFPDRFLISANYAVCNSKGVHILGNNGGWFIWDGNPESKLFAKVKPPHNWDITDAFREGDGIIFTLHSTITHESGIYRYDNGGFVPIDTAYYHVSEPWVTSAWTPSDRSIISYAGDCGAVVREGSNRVTRWSEDIVWFTDRTRGSASNNVWFAGSNLTILHFNGSTIHRYILFPQQPDRFLDLWVSESRVIIVGESGYIVRGYKR